VNAKAKALAYLRSKSKCQSGFVTRYLKPNPLHV